MGAVGVKRPVGMRQGMAGRRRHRVGDGRRETPSDAESSAPNADGREHRPPMDTVPQPNPRHLSAARSLYKRGGRDSIRGTAAASARAGRRNAVGVGRRQRAGTGGRRRKGVPRPHRDEPVSGPVSAATARATVARRPRHAGRADSHGPARPPPPRAEPHRPNRLTGPLRWASSVPEPPSAPVARAGSGAGAEAAHRGELDA
jgi:hypothetical protein